MASTGKSTSQNSDGSSVVDLPCTYTISQTVWLQEPSPQSLEEDICATLTSASSPASLKNTGSRITSSEDNVGRQFEGDEKSQNIPQSSDSLTVTQQSAATLNSLHKLETNQGLDDGQVRASLDAFYEQSTWGGKNDTLSRQLSEKISDLSKKQHLYALRSFQLAKIVLNQEGEKALQRFSTNNLFSETKNAEPIPGLSEDVVRFIMEQNSSLP